MNYRSTDNKLGVEINETLIEQMLGYIRSSDRKETGGILMGDYDQCRIVAHILHITGPPPDSRSGPTWFQRGVKGLQSLINRSWQNREYYLGEWHFHPGGTADPSRVDIDQMAEIARSKKYACPEPVLILVGGSPEDYEIKVRVFVNGGLMMELHHVQGMNDLVTQSPGIIDPVR